MEKFKINRANTILVIIDIQDRLAAAMKYKDTIVENCLHLVEAAKLMEIPIFVTEQYPKGLGPTTEKIQTALPEYKPYEKVAFDCCGNEAFVEDIKSLDRSHVLLTGMETHVCVLQTCISLLTLGYQVHCVMDAISSRTKENYKIGQEFMRDAGAVISGTETVLFQLMEKAGTPEFKIISERIK